MTSVIHVALAQYKPRKGDYAANLVRVGEILAAASRLDPRPRVVVLPETALTGYFVEGGVRDVAVSAGRLARDLHRAYASSGGGGAPLDVVIGFYERWRDTLYNSAMYVTLDAVGEDRPGEPDANGDAAFHIIRHLHRKNFLPTYGLFDEERFVERGYEIRAFDAGWGRAALLVCEDAWHSLSGTVAALDGAQVVFVVSAAPARGIWPRDDGVPGPASVARWERLVRDIAEEHGVFCALANLVGSEGGKAFSGSSLVAGPHGDVRVRGPVFEEAIVTLSLDLGDLVRARADSPLLADLRTALPHIRALMDRIERGDPVRVEYDDDCAGPSASPNGKPVAAAAGEGAVGAAAPAGGPPPQREVAKNSASTRHPTAAARRDSSPASAIDDGAAAAGLRVVRPDPRRPEGPPPIDIDPALTERWLVEFIRDEMHRRGFRKAVVGVSGGVDSAVTAFLAARALGAENVVGVRLPYRTSSPQSLEHAQLVIDALGIEGRTLDISAAVDGYLANEPDAGPARRGNVMARTRMIALFDLSERYRALPLGTGNKTERLFGYFTWHADDSPPVNPLGDLFKTQVWALARHLGVPEVIVGKPASADLIQGQTDEGDFGISYAKADAILNWLLNGYDTADLTRRGFDAADVALVRKRLEGTHWKRRLPTVAMVSPTAIGEAYLRPVDY
ncbi:MAG TPA: NAD+ synthase [Gemmatimonadaceae bacterium]|nr:NAD+ synthase [Gemmatimonadaceae bacterium]